MTSSTLVGKVALTTWWHYYNYGTALQAVALYNVIKSFGCKTDMVDYIPHGRKYPVDSGGSTPATDWGTAERVVDERRDRKFDEFVEKHLTYTQPCNIDEDFEALNKKYDAFVTGSDQIWSPIVFDSRYYFDYIGDNRKKIAYAPSMGVSSIDNQEVKEQMTNLISQFAHLSSREQKGSDLIAELIGKKPELVLDPTLLLSHAEWRKIIPVKKSQRPKDKYILCYFLGENDNARKHALAISKQSGLPIKILPVFTKDEALGELVSGTGPEEYFHLIDGAGIILTDSFHGAIFSIICQKPFYVFDRFRNDDKLSQNSRVHNLLKMTSLEERLIPYDQPAKRAYDFDLNFKKAYDMIEKNKQKSLTYLKNSLIIDHPLVSVILPVYNVEKYIRRCLDSILMQTYSNLEIILVDDGTPDKSGAIADQYADKDHRIKVIHKENGGPSTARNAGLEIAKGDFIVFVDPDDAIAPNCIEYLLSLIENTDTNIGISLNCYNEYTDPSFIPISDDRFQILSAEAAIRGIYAWEMKEAVWNKIYRTDFLIKNDLAFHAGIRSGEGITFNMMALQKSGPVATGRRKIYFQTYNPTSATRSTNMKNWDTTFFALQYQADHATINTPAIKRARFFHIWWAYCCCIGLIYKHKEQVTHASYLKRYTAFIREHMSFALRADISKQRKYECIRIFINPKKEMLKTMKQWEAMAKNNILLFGDKLPWEIKKTDPLYSTLHETKQVYFEQELNNLKQENARLKAELESFRNVPRSVKLFIGNVVRRVKRK